MTVHEYKQDLITRRNVAHIQNIGKDEQNDSPSNWPVLQLFLKLMRLKMNKSRAMFFSGRCVFYAPEMQYECS